MFLNTKYAIRKVVVSVMAFLMLVNLITIPNAYSITFREEQQLGDEVMEQVFQYYREVTDPYVSDYINRLGHRLLGSLDPQPFAYSFHIIDDPNYNAFAIPGGHIFVNSGLIIAMSEEGELVGVMSHEISHVTSRHISAKLERSSRNTLLAMGGVLAAVLVGMAGGGRAGEMSQAVMVGSLGAVTASELSYSRDDELQADQVGLYIMTNNGYNPQSMINVLNKIKSQSFYTPKDFPSYLSSHPALDDRIAYIRTWMGSVDGRNAVSYDHDQVPFNYAKTRLIAYYGDPKLEMPKVLTALKNNPNDVDSRYRYALLLNRSGERNKAIEELSKVLQTGVYNGYVLNDLGRIYFDSGNFDKAQELLEKAAPLLNNDPENRVYLGRIYADNGQADKAVDILLRATRDFPDYAETYYFLAHAYNKHGSQGWAHYYLAIYYLKRHDMGSARKQLDMAFRNAGSDAALKAQAEELYNSIWRRQNRQGDEAEVLDPIGGGGKK